jgi:hypothetical protein
VDGIVTAEEQVAIGIQREGSEVESHMRNL